ncbi:hypothetical protein HET69_35970 [Streptomyces sp. CJ_13]|uniref:hypothetical protein n=1 Tax=Streptomyces sp. CJ_13 TaxID=2724943 RepID=UPI001BDDC467|nr:hypothetical protein [Streptomyces sp. CJ_13]MBT1189242.1 hypothetical protein [Streptomyces sp. CJ_13]
MTATAPIPAASPHDVDLSQVMFRQALRESRRAADYAERAAKEEAAGGTGLQLRMRERDAVTTTIILTQAAAEAFFNWTHIRAGVTPTGVDFMSRASLMRMSAAKLNSGAPTFDWTKAEKKDFELLTAWRNFLGHSDAKARDRLRNELVKRGELPAGAGDQQITALLTTALAERIISSAEAAFQRVGVIVGGAPSSHGAWIGQEELEVPALEDPEQLRSLLRVLLRRTGPVRLSHDELLTERDRQRSGPVGLFLRLQRRGRSGRLSVELRSGGRPIA